MEFDFFDEAEYLVEDYARTGSNRYYIGKVLSIIFIAPSIIAFVVMAYANFSIADEMTLLNSQYHSLYVIHGNMYYIRLSQFYFCVLIFLEQFNQSLIHMTHTLDRNTIQVGMRGS